MATQKTSNANQQLLRILFEGGSSEDLFKLFRYKLYICTSDNSVIADDGTIDYNKNILKQKRPIKLNVIEVQDHQLILESELVNISELVKADQEYFDEAVITITHGAGMVAKVFKCDKQTITPGKKIIFSFKIEL